MLNVRDVRPILQPTTYNNWYKLKNVQDVNI